jgi:DNA-directed RNA polymerase subunit E'/Rpb7
MNNPFIDTMLYTTVVLHPSQLNNEIYNNLKSNLTKNLEKRCYKKYGYISKIYEILERDNGIIIPEDITSSVLFKIKFSCRLCHPLENTKIICKVNQTTDIFISLVRDPIHVIVTTDEDRINKEIFYKDPHEKKLRIKETNELLQPGTFVIATILTKSFTDKDKKIIALGRLDSIASDKDIEKYYTDEYSIDKQFLDFENYTTDKKPEEVSETSKEDFSTTSDASHVVDKVSPVVDSEPPKFISDEISTDDELDIKKQNVEVSRSKTSKKKSSKKSKSTK